MEEQSSATTNVTGCNTLSTLSATVFCGITVLLSCYVTEYFGMMNSIATNIENMFFFDVST